MAKAEFNPLEKDCLDNIYDRLDDHLNEQFENVGALVQACFKFETDSSGMCVTTEQAENWIKKFWVELGDYVDLYNIENENPLNPFGLEEWFMLQIIILVCTNCINDYYYYWEDFTLTAARIDKLKELIDNCTVINN